MQIPDNIINQAVQGYGGLMPTREGRDFVPPTTSGKHTFMTLGEFLDQDPTGTWVLQIDTTVYTITRVGEEWDFVERS